jgi:uncharacterized membrane protein
MNFIKTHLVRNRQNKLIFLLTVFCIFLVTFRIVYSQTIHYRFLLWNLFLAIVPLLITHFMLVTAKRKTGKLKMTLVLGGWLLFFPNAPYILTDLFHLKQNSSMPLWFDLVLILSFAWTGLLAGFLSLQHIERTLLNWMSKSWSGVLVMIMMFMSGFGIYLGRFLRWNSWDIFRKPGELANDVADRFINPFEHPGTWGVTFFVGMMLVIMYWSLNSFLEREQTPLKFGNSKN